MTITKRDKKLLFVAIGVLILIIGYIYFIKPHLDTRDELDIKLETLEAERDFTEARIATLPASIQDMQQLEEQYRELISGYYPLMTNREIDNIVTGVLTSHNVQVLGLAITGADELKAVRPFGDEDSEQPKSLYVSVVEFRVMGNESVLWAIVDDFASGSTAIRIDAYQLSTKNTGLKAPVIVDGIDMTGSVAPGSSSETAMLEMTVSVFMCDK